MAVRMLTSFSVLVFIFCHIHVSEETYLDWKSNTRKYGESCINNDECIDFRMSCSKTELVCRCDQFYDWTELDPYRTECVLNIDRLRAFLTEQHEKKPVIEDELSEEAHNLFFYLGVAGIIAISLGVFLALACVIFVFAN